MTENKTCPKCGAQLPANAPAGICPKCLMQAGLASAGDVGSLPEMKPTTFASGFVPPEPQELAKHFPQLEIIELLGKGGMGAVYKARQRGLDRLVAVKVLPPEVGHDTSFAERFTREARALARLSHNHIVSVHDFGQADGLFFIVMEFVDGINLRQTIQSGGLKPVDALAIIPQICEALQFAHDEGIVHRDIKPENILIDKKGRVKIADFGLAKLLGQDASHHSLTATHQVMGTLRYMAPEQMQGSREVDHRADIYSLGVVFYELLTGELPMGKFAPPSKRVQVDVRLDEIVLRALEQEPEQRYQHASEVKTDVDAIVQGGEQAKQPSRAGFTDSVTFVERAWDTTDLLVRLVRTLWPGVFVFFVAVALIVLGFWAITGIPYHQAAQRKPEILRVIPLVPGLGSLLASIVLAVHLKHICVRSVTMNATGLTMHSGSQPNRFLRWDEIAGLPAFREHWWGCVGSKSASARDYFGIDSNQGFRRYFRPGDRREFLAAIDRFAPPDAAWADALRAESEGMAMPARPKPTPFATASRSESPDRPPLVLVFAALDLIAAVLLILVFTAGDHVLVPATVSWLWHAWGISEVVLGLLGSAGLLTASLALFLWKPWARKLMLGVCFFALAAVVIDLPYLAQVAIPAAFEEARQAEIAKGYNTVDADRVASLGLTIGFGGLFVIVVTWLIGHLVYFTRPRVVAAFESQRE